MTKKEEVREIISENPEIKRALSKLELKLVEAIIKEEQDDHNV